ncbi:beta-glucosidase BglX [Thaumasiovibrio sp. DFM-14]|uniref:beta-glucosidase BglX n=1 Tax=Thaumasiovibrio sp. DFM-14 TaxID=3384792 RepID=UPI0039A2029D
MIGIQTKKLISVSGLFFIVACFSGLSYGSESKVEKILGDLTLEEKIGQLNLISIEGQPTQEQVELIKSGLVGSVIKSHGVADIRRIQDIAVNQSRSGLPILFQEDVIHGYKTIAPVPLAEAASWDMDAIRRSAAVAAREAAASGINLTYAPMVDITRDVRWGRVIEAAGEDPYLGARIAEARVRGFQETGKDAYQNLLSCVKHFAGYGAALAGRDYNIRDISERELREIHLPPFQAAFDADVACVMGAYTAYDGVPATANTHLMKDILRNEMGFTGLVMTDWETIPNLVKTGIASDTKAATIMAMNAGYDMDMVSRSYISLLPDLVEEGLVTEKAIDESVRQVLRLKQKAGLLDDPFMFLDEEREYQELLSDVNWKTVRDIATKSMVLLKNDESILPISNETKSIAIIGPYAKADRDLLGWWHAKGEASDVVTFYDGLRDQLQPDVVLSYAKGVQIDGFAKVGADMISEAVAIAAQSELAIVVVGEDYWMSGEGGSIASLHLPGLQEELIREVYKVQPNLVTVVASGRPYVLTDVVKHSKGVLQAWMPGTTGGEALAAILLGQESPSGKLPVSFPYHTGQVPIFYNYKRTSHIFDAGPDDNRYTTTFRDVPSEPLFPFGFGLSYTDFEYSEVKMSQKELMAAESLTASVTIKNTGARAGREIAQLYIGSEVASVTRPLMELKGFHSVELLPGEQTTVEFPITVDMLSFIGTDNTQTIEQGVFNVYIGSSSTDTRKSTFKLNL